MIYLTDEERVELAKLLSARVLSPVQHYALDRWVNAVVPPPLDEYERMALTNAKRVLDSLWPPGSEDHRQTRRDVLLTIGTIDRLLAEKP